MLTSNTLCDNNITKVEEHMSIQQCKTEKKVIKDYKFLQFVSEQNQQGI